MLAFVGPDFGIHIPRQVPQPFLKGMHLPRLSLAVLSVKSIVQDLNKAMLCNQGLTKVLKTCIGVDSRRMLGKSLCPKTDRRMGDPYDYL